MGRDGASQGDAIAPAPPWLLEMAEALPPETGAGGAGGRALPTGTGEIVRDAWGKVIDGRERFMVGIVCGVIAAMAREAGALPAPEAVVAEAWPTYERAARPRGASLDADGRGIALLRQRVGHFLRRARDGKWDLDKSRETREAPPLLIPATRMLPRSPLPQLTTGPRHHPTTPMGLRSRARARVRVGSREHRRNRKNSIHHGRRRVGRHRSIPLSYRIRTTSNSPEGASVRTRLVLQSGRPGRRIAPPRQGYPSAS